ncbi:NADH-quinone oxidoreductase subunit NuoE [Thermococcus waiotapuensis]|uniref:NADH-quinone oxidoreductase subunit NuoE n=1 Tax=Thermococcus waiotapuensis TaxID=90909 RepID=A0AAE4NVY4_9EURY|nr:NADH-quinone oxidoreductase subunit NuoE [Thermococcus waiotapuensis]MDV3103833.1 NADH-quinone oxidoreductase subunit NuoE [Thermococcus waiotapuensis]
MEAELDYIRSYPPEPGSLIPLLQRTQERFGYLPKEALEEIARYLGIPLSKVYGVATFYAQFRFEPLGKYVVKICHGTACHVNGSVNISQAIREELGIEEGQTSEDGLVTLERVACLGCCSLAPVIMVNEKVFGKLTPEKVRKLIRKLREGKLDV